MIKEITFVLSIPISALYETTYRKSSRAWQKTLLPVVHNVEIESSPKITVDGSSSLNNNKSLLQPSYNRYQKVMIDDPISGGKVEKIYLDREIFISSENWDSIQNQKNDSKFVKNLAQAIWTRHELVNRSLDGKGAARIVNRSPRKMLTPKKRQVIEACFQDRITKQQPGLTGTNLEKAVKGSGRYLTELINDLIKREVKNSKK
ncbi:hypothetical protein KQX54_007220 [Cotesia glomerata]|uniref:BEN domain-containing protein n=1 Tax=Cotesia glomerata TaxID=32391 RepID=A0AAV7ITT0_COTGL|nr:hypothetical protein KQX54_007220 [Cotesia glomerata]